MYRVPVKEENDVVLLRKGVLTVTEVQFKSVRSKMINRIKRRGNGDSWDAFRMAGRAAAVLH
jgi:hypothetical protein